jgi:hypothetical protein
MDRHEKEGWLLARGFVNVDAIVGAAEEGDRPTLARCCALLLNETAGGANIYGHEGPLPELWGQEVTEENYQRYKAARARGEGVNGVGPTQLTDAGLQIDAERLGGCWNAYHNCQVGFRLLHELIERYGVHDGARRYNGSGPAAEAYADRFVAHEQQLLREGLS